MMFGNNPWHLVLSVWRGAILAIRDLPLLVVGSVLLYTLASAFWLHDVPFRMPRGLISPAGYILLHGIVFAPLMLSVMLNVSKPQTQYSDIWGAAVMPIAAVIICHNILILGDAVVLRILRPALGMLLAKQGLSFPLAAVIYVLPAIVVTAAIFLLSVRLILLLPLLGLEKIDWKIVFPKAWSAMSGHYGFALAVSLAVILPLAVAERGLNRLYRLLYSRPDFPGPLTLRQWEALIVYSAGFALDTIVVSALSAGLYLAIRSRAAPDVAPYSGAQVPGPIR